MATGTLPAASCSVKLRPLAIGIPNVRKYPGVTIVNPALGREERSTGGCPAMLKAMLQFVPTTGAPVEAAAEVIPGRASIFSSSWR